MVVVVIVVVVFLYSRRAGGAVAMVGSLQMLGSFPKTKTTKGNNFVFGCCCWWGGGNGDTSSCSMFSTVATRVDVETEYGISVSSHAKDCVRGIRRVISSRKMPMPGNKTTRPTVQRSVAPFSGVPVVDDGASHR